MPELQLLSQAIFYLRPCLPGRPRRDPDTDSDNPCPIDYASVVVYTCERSCRPHGGLADEHVLFQPDPDATALKDLTLGE
jgi:hypothetical protein